MNPYRFLTRRNSVLALVGLLVILGFIFGIKPVMNYLSGRPVTFKLPQNVSSIVITNSDTTNSCSNDCPDVIKESLQKSGQVRLLDGLYSVTPSGNNINTERIYITVNKDATTFTISPSYSEEYLKTVLLSETTFIQSALRAVYPNISEQYYVSDGKLYAQGDWYITSLMPLSNGSVDVYYVILHKTDGVWKIAAKPSLYFTYAEYPSILKNVLYQANSSN